MSGNFRAGQLVRPEVWYINRLDLTSEPLGPMTLLTAAPRSVGYLDPHDVAVVIAVHRDDGSSIYVLGPHGGGWATGALLRVVRDPPVP